MLGGEDPRSTADKGNLKLKGLLLFRTWKQTKYKHSNLIPRRLDPLPSPLPLFHPPSKISPSPLLRPSSLALSSSSLSFPLKTARTCILKESGFDDNADASLSLQFTGLPQVDAAVTLPTGYAHLHGVYTYMYTYMYMRCTCIYIVHAHDFIMQTTYSSVVNGYAREPL